MIFTNLVLIAAGIVLVGAILVISSQAFQFIFAYSVNESGIVVQLFHVIPIYRIPFRSIKKLYEAPFYEVALVPGMHLFTRPFGRRVVIDMGDKWPKFAFLTPINPTSFIEEIKRHLSNA
jgi:hypothetical protein